MYEQCVYIHTQLKSLYKPSMVVHAYITSMGAKLRPTLPGKPSCTIGQSFFFLPFFFFFFETGLHYAAPGGSGACYVDLAGLVLIEMQLPLSQIYIFTCVPYEYLKVRVVSHHV